MINESNDEVASFFFTSFVVILYLGEVPKILLRLLLIQELSIVDQ